MSIVRIDVPGWDTFTGLLGMVPFENGVSSRELTQAEMLRIGANIAIVKVGSNEQVGAAVTMVNSRNISAEVKVASKTLEQETVAKVAYEYDRERLEEIASEGGIKAVREIAAKYNVKGVEISKMIEEILKAQEPQKEAK
jgi:hypothetical protein